MATQITINPPIRRYLQAGGVVCWALAIAIICFACVADLTKTATVLTPELAAPQHGHQHE